MLVLTVLLAIFSYVNMETKGEEVKGVKDVLFIWSTPMNEFYIKNTYKRNCLIIFASLILDILLFTAFYRWARYSSTYRLILASILFYGLRALCQALIVVEYP